jgi:hypothetical protein
VEPVAANINDRVPIVPHADIADVDCCGCLMVHIRKGQADILCNECGTVVRIVSVSEIETTMLDLAQTDTICTVVANQTAVIRYCLLHSRVGVDERHDPRTSYTDDA